jgi:TPR repeat protein
MKELRAQIEARLPDRELLALKGRAEEGDTETQSRLGVCYAHGQGVATNYVKAVNWWRKAAEQNSALAQSCLGTCYYLGQGVDKNYEEAVKWYRKAAEQNRPEAQYSLALCYAKGEGVAKDDLQAVKWFRKAAEGGELNALNALAWILATSRNSAVRDGSNAVVLAEKATAARHYKNPATLDTLAAAYAEAGQFEKAVSTEQEAIALLQTEAEKSDYRTRLQLFEAKVSYRSKD